MPKIVPGEIIYLNLPYHPGNRLDKKPPTPPNRVTLREAENMGYPGVEVAWKPGSDDHWLSHYLVYRNGQVIDKVANGTYYFDHSLGADLGALYGITSVDGSGNVSPVASAGYQSYPRWNVYDDKHGRLEYAGEWRQVEDDNWAHNNTMTSSQKAGDSVEFEFRGRSLQWFTKMGPECGLATIEVDGKEETVDTYSADSIWGIAVWRREFDSPGPHTIKLTVVGQHLDHPSDVNRDEAQRRGATWVHVDGFRIGGAAPDSATD